MTLSSPPSPPHPFLLILYASQTGNAEYIARFVREEAELRRGFPAKCCSADEFAGGKGAVNFDSVFGEGKEPPLLFLVASTTGDGDVPDNATKFYRFLKRDPRRTSLQGKKYMLLGLGDTNYDVFCGGAKRLDREMLKLGMECVAERGWADDATGIEAVVDPFVAALLNRLPELVRHDPSLISSSEVAVGSTIKRPSSGIGTPRKSPKLESRPVISEAKVPEPAQSLPRAVLPGSRPVLPAAMLPSVTDTVPVSVTPKLPEPEILAPAPAVSLSVSAAPSSSASSSEFFTCIPSSVFGELDAEIAKHKQLTNVTKSPILALSLSPSTGSTDLVSNSDLSYTQSNPFAATISGSRILTGSKALQPVHEVTFASLPWTYEAGAALSVLAPNPPELVDRMLSLLQFDDVTASFAVSGCEKAGITHAFTRNDGGVLVSPKLALQWIPDLSQFPAKPVLRFLADRATDKSEKRRLLFLCSKEGIASYRALRESGATTADLLELFPSAIPKGSDAVTFLGVLCEHAARLQARCYSYSSAPSSSNVSVAFNTQEWTTPHGIKRRGIATSHLLSRVGGQVLVFPRIETGGFVAPESAYEGNVLMIATGTGITPFRAFLEARAKQTADQRKGKWWLVYGCRFAGEEGDSVYLDEIRTWKEQGVLDRLDVVYSRDTGRSELSAEFGAEQKAGAKYVQHALALHASELYSFLADDNSIVYTCGEYKTMGRGVVTALAEIWEERQGWEKGKGIEYWMEERGEKGGYRRDVWG